MEGDEDVDAEVQEVPPKGKRRQVWTEKEKIWILEYIHERRSSCLLLKNPSNEKAGNKKELRETQLANLYEEFMVDGSPTQAWTMMNIRTLLKNLKSAGKTARSQHKAHIRGTGGGAAKHPSRMEELLVELGDDSAEPLAHMFDSDATTSRASLDPHDLSFSRRKGKSANSASASATVTRIHTQSDAAAVRQTEVTDDDDITEVLSHTALSGETSDDCTPPLQRPAKRSSTSPAYLASSKKVKGILSTEERFIEMREAEHVLTKKKLQLEIELMMEEKALNKKRMELLDLKIKQIRPADPATSSFPVQTVPSQQLPSSQPAECDDTPAVTGSVFHPPGYFSDGYGNRWPQPARLSHQ